MKNLYEYIIRDFKINEPIFVEELLKYGIAENTVRQSLYRLQKENKIEKFDTGIYYLATETILGKSVLSLEKVLLKKYIEDNLKNTFGFISGLKLANLVGLTSQVPYIYEITTNKTTTSYREIVLKNRKIILRKSPFIITSENVKILQFLDTVLNAETYSELNKKDTIITLNKLKQTLNISSEDIQKYLDYYPNRIYKVLYEMEIIKNENS